MFLKRNKKNDPKKAQKLESELKNAPLEKESKARHELLEKSKYTGFNPVSIVVNKNIAARFWFCSFWVLVVIVACVIIVDKIHVKNEKYVSIVTSDGRIIRTPLLEFYQATPLHELCIMLATESLLDKNPNGFDKLDLLKQMYFKNVYEAIIADQKEQQELYELKDIHQKCEGLKIKAYKSEHDYVRALVVGQLIRTETFEGRTDAHKYNFELELKMYRNPNIASNLNMPYAVSWLDLEVTEADK
ncbi:MAG TPA: hypothetical protein QF753_07155 [Victivallales bacterium]|nr:hypothetical protein [Victivallales bacterium]